MFYKPNTAFYGLFCITDATGAAANADSLPTATATKNGSDDGAFALTVANMATGRYKITGTVPSGYVSGDRVQISVAATVGGIASIAVVASFGVDTKYIGSLNDVAAGAQMDLVNSPNNTALTALANKVEAEIIDDTDSEKVLTAITDKIASVNPSLAGLTLAAIASQVRTELTTELQRIDAAVSSRLATGSYTAPPSAATVASQVRAELTTELGRVDVAVSSRLATASYAVAPTAAAIADAVWDELRSGHMTAGSYGEWFSLLCLRFLAFGLVVRNGTHILVYDTDGETLLLSIPFVYDGETEQMGPGE